MAFKEFCLESRYQLKEVSVAHFFAVGVYLVDDGKVQKRAETTLVIVL